jgi:hypothetical protein
MRDDHSPRGEERMNATHPIELQRLIYRPGQTLLSRDFRAQAIFDAQRRWWHNRSVHNSYGIALALPKIELNTERQCIEIGRFLAYDCFGRELVNCCDVCVEFPKLNSRDPRPPERFVLVAQYRQGDTCPGVQNDSLPPHCKPECISPHLCWVHERWFTPMKGVPLAVVLATDPFKLDSTFTLFRSQRLGRPRIVSGETISNSTIWKAVGTYSDRSVLRRYETHIDISGQRLSRPCCFAELQGPQSDSELDLMLLYTRVVDCNCRSIRFEVGVQESTALSFPRFALENKLHICWICIESSCLPTFNCKERHESD